MPRATKSDGKTKPRKRARAVKKAPRKPGRPSMYSEAMVSEICRRLHESDGDALPESLRAICRDPKMPSVVTVSDWLNTKPEFAKRYAHARDLRKDALVDRIIHLSEKAKSQAYGDPGTGEAGAKVAAYKLEIDTIKWILSKEYARDYGDRIAQEISGPDGGPLQSVLSITPEVEDRIKQLGKVRAEMKPPQGYEKPNQT